MKKLLLITTLFFVNCGELTEALTPACSNPAEKRFVIWITHNGPPTEAYKYADDFCAASIEAALLVCQTRYTNNVNYACTK